MPKQSTIEDMKVLADRHGGKCLSPLYLSARTKLKWQCSNGHIWEARPDNVKHENWCPLCSRRRASAERMGNLTEMLTVARSRGGKCLSEEYHGNNHKLQWQCDKGHTWAATPGNIKSGKWCPHCGGTHRLSIAEMRRLASEHGGLCLSDTYLNRKTKLSWQCEHGHIWLAMPDSIKSGKWCPLCGVQRRSTARSDSIETMHNIADQRGGKCLSNSYDGNHRKLTWMCSEGHTWQAVPSSIKAGTWCPECASGVGERICRAYFTQLFGCPFPKIRPKWLRTSRGTQLELDGYAESMNLAFEYQGVQHYSEDSHYHKTAKAFVLRQSLDELKRERCKSRGVILIEVPEIPTLMELDHLKTFIYEKCVAANITLPADFDNIIVNLRSAYAPENKTQFAELQAIAATHAGSILTPAFLGARTKHRWKCAKGHEWEAAPYSVRSGRWCRLCATEAVATSQRGTLEDCQKLAEDRGGKCLSIEYRNVETKLTWQCALGHQWQAKTANIKHGQWCPVCGIKRRTEAQRGTLEQMQKVAAAKGGKCLSDKYVNSGTKLEWECRHGHKWQAKPGNIVFGQWCPICGRSRPRKQERGQQARPRRRAIEHINNED